MKFIKQLLSHFIAEVWLKSYLWLKVYPLIKKQKSYEKSLHCRITQLIEERNKIAERSQMWHDAWFKQRDMTGRAYWQGVSDALLKPNTAKYLPSVTLEPVMRAINPEELGKGFSFPKIEGKVK
jgi:hypothetical protein